MSEKRLLEIAIELAGLGQEFNYYGLSSAAVYCDMTLGEVVGELGRMARLARVSGELEPEVVS